MKIKISISLAIIAIIGVITYLGFYRPSESLNEEEAISFLTDTIARDSLYDSFTTLECLNVEIDEAEKTYFVFSIYEKHGNGCAGDPNTRPRVDTYRVMRQTKAIFYYDLLEDSYHPYDASKLRRQIWL